jgi:membrane protein
MATAHTHDSPSDVRDAIRRGLSSGRPFAPVRWWAAAKVRAVRWADLDVMRKSAALSYYAAFSTVPILVIALWVGALVVDAANLRTHVMAQIGSVFGPTTSEWVASAIAQAGDMESGIAAILSGALLVLGATTALTELKSSLDEIFGTRSNREESWLSVVRARAYAVGLILTFGFMLVLSLFASAALSSAMTWGGDRFGLSGVWVARIIAEASTFLSTAALFAAVYAWLPSRHIGWRAVVRATLISAVLFSIGRWIVATWLATSDAVSSFGAAASLALVLLWFYYSAVIFYTAAILAAGEVRTDADAR